MASILKVDEMQGVTSAGEITVTGYGGTGTMTMQRGLTVMWAAIKNDQTGIWDSMNQSSFSDDGTGTGTCNYTNNMEDGNYGTVSNIVFRPNGSTNNTRTSASIDRTSSNHEVQSGYTNGSGVFLFYDTQKDAAVNGDLA